MKNFSKPEKEPDSTGQSAQGCERLILGAGRARARRSAFVHTGFTRHAVKTTEAQRLETAPDKGQRKNTLTRCSDA
jgi:hypothetical protein